MTERERKPTFDPEYIRDLSEAVYREQLGADDTARMIDKDGDGGKKLRARSGSYDSLTRSYLEALGIQPGGSYPSTIAPSTKQGK